MEEKKNGEGKEENFWRGKCHHGGTDKERSGLFLGEHFLGESFFWMRGVTGVTGVTRGRYPPSYLVCLIHQDSENIAHS